MTPDILLVRGRTLSLSAILAGCADPETLNVATRAAAPDLSLRSTLPEPCANCTDLIFEGRVLHLEPQPLVTAADIRRIRLRRDHASGISVLDIELEPQAGPELAKATAARIGTPIAWVKGQQILIVANVNAPFGSRSQLSGTDETQVRELYDQMTDAQ